MQEAESCHEGCSSMQIALAEVGWEETWVQQKVKRSSDDSAWADRVRTVVSLSLMDGDSAQYPLIEELSCAILPAH